MLLYSFCWRGNKLMKLQEPTQGHTKCDGAGTLIQCLISVTVNFVQHVALMTFVSVCISPQVPIFCYLVWSRCFYEGGLILSPNKSFSCKIASWILIFPCTREIGIIRTLELILQIVQFFFLSGLFVKLWWFTVYWSYGVFISGIVRDHRYLACGFTHLFLLCCEGRWRLHLGCTGLWGRTHPLPGRGKSIYSRSLSAISLEPVHRMIAVRHVSYFLQVLTCGISCWC